MKIITGGQTGADRAGIDAALSTTSYSIRTEKNVVDADATVIFIYNRIGSGSALTIRTVAGETNTGYSYKSKKYKKKNTGELREPNTSKDLRPMRVSKNA